MENLGTIVNAQIVPRVPLQAVHRVSVIGGICEIRTVECHRVGGADPRTEARDPCPRIVPDIDLLRSEFRGRDRPVIVNRDRRMARPILVYRPGCIHQARLPSDRLRITGQLQGHQRLIERVSTDPTIGYGLQCVHNPRSMSSLRRARRAPARNRPIALRADQKDTTVRAAGVITGNSRKPYAGKFKIRLVDENIPDIGRERIAVWWSAIPICGTRQGAGAPWRLPDA